jgi:hypothetical protein
MRMSIAESWICHQEQVEQYSSPTSSFCLKSLIAQCRHSKKTIKWRRVVDDERVQKTVTSNVDRERSFLCYRGSTHWLPRKRCARDGATSDECVLSNFTSSDTFDLTSLGVRDTYSPSSLLVWQVTYSATMPPALSDYDSDFVFDDPVSTEFSGNKVRHHTAPESASQMVR